MGPHHRSRQSSDTIVYPNSVRAWSKRASTTPISQQSSMGRRDRLLYEPGLIFPTPGCWEATGKAGQAELTFVALVIKVEM